jgi:sugar lactone lactonase YvrE
VVSSESVAGQSRQVCDVRKAVKTVRELQCIWRVAAELGERPIWSDREKALYSVDILGCSIHRWQENIQTRSWITPAEPGFVLPCDSVGLICGLRGGLYHFDPSLRSLCLPSKKGLITASMMVSPTLRDEFGSGP